MSGESTQETGVIIDYADDTEREQSRLLAEARQQLASEGTLSMCPPWAALADDERDVSMVEARNWLRAARRCGLIRPAAEQRAERAETRVAEYEQYEADARRILDAKSEALAQAQAVIERVRDLAEQYGSTSDTRRPFYPVVAAAIVAALGEPPADPRCITVDRDTRMLSRVERVRERLDWLIDNGFGATTYALVEMREWLGHPPAEKEEDPNPAGDGAR